MKQSLMLACVLIIALTALAGRSLAAERSEKDPDWKLTMKTYSLSLRGLTFYETVDKSAALGIKYLEVWPWQKVGGGLPGDMSVNKLDAATRAKVLAKCKSAGVTIIGYGVASPKTEPEWRQLFEFAKALGCKFIVSEPDPAQLGLVDQLCNQYRIDVAIHNHPQPSIYWNPETVLKAIQGRSKCIGACADTGHWSRSGLDPVACLKELDGRIIMLHFKDLNAKGPKAHDVVWGEGVCRVKEMLAELKRQHFKGAFSIEYEHPEDVLENLPAIVAFFNRCQAMTEDELRVGTGR